MTSNNSAPQKEGSIMGVSFSDVHSDELHESVLPEGTNNPQRTSSTHSQAQAKKNTFDVGNALDRESIEEGTIVTDRRRVRKSFGASLKSAFNEWLEGTKVRVSDIQQKVSEIAKKEEATIAPAETRKEVVAQATTHANLAPKDDSNIVVEKIRTFKTDVSHITHTPLIKDASLIKTEPTWGDTHEVPHVVPEHTHDQDEKSETWKKFDIADLRETTIAPPITKPIIKTQVSSTSTPHETTASRVHIPKNEVVKIDARNNPLSVAPTIPNATKKEVVREVEAFANAKPLSKEEVLSHITQNKPETSHKPDVIRWTTDTRTNTDVPPPITAPQPPPQHTEKKVGQAPLHHDDDISQHHIVAPALQQSPSISHIPVAQPSDSTTHIPAPPSQKIVRTYSRINPTPVPDFHQNPIPASRISAPTPSQNTGSPDVSRAAFSPETSTSSSRVMQYTIRIGSVCIIIVIGVALAFTFKSNSTQVEKNSTSLFSPNTGTATTSLSLIPTEITKSIQLPDTASSLKETAAHMVDSATFGITDIRFTKNSGGISSEVTSKELLAYLGVSLPQNTQRALDNQFMFGVLTTETPSPFLILRSYNFDILFAGMLAWENYIIPELKPIFGDMVATEKFTDTIVHNHPTRVLKNEQGDIVLAYTIVKNTTLVITTHTTTLETLIEKIK
ncbi:MAG TPA: hypothetical protein VFV22_02655 [Candidatus Paceibacterota bacterium]|nr:hypothetical protein [Candidatus Paceibacterota bacterium]